MYNEVFKKQMSFASYDQLSESPESDLNRKTNISITHHYGCWSQTKKMKL